MNLFKSFGLLLAMGSGVMSSLLALAYPATERPSRVSDEECLEDPEGIAQACAINRGAGAGIPRLKVVYNGYLSSDEYEGVYAFIRLNGESSFYKLERTEEGYSRTFGMPQEEYLCVVKKEDPQYPLCPSSIQDAPGTLRWFVKPAADEELILFRRINRSVREPLGWNVELAFVSVDGRHWDSQYGKNYVFSFNP